MKSYGVIIQMKATEQYFSLVLFIIYRAKWFWSVSLGMKSGLNWVHSCETAEQFHFLLPFTDHATQVGSAF